MTAAGHGEARLRFAHQGRRTVLAESYARAPLAIRGPLVGPGGAARVALITLGGGLSAGDHIHITIDTEPNTNVSVGAIGATRLLPSAAPCLQTTTLRLAAGSRLLYLPEPLIPCRDAMYDQRTYVDLAPGATAVLGEVLTPGRLAHNECFAYRSLRLGLEVRGQGRPLLVDRLIMEPRAGHLPTLLGAHTHLAGLVILGPPATADLAARIHALLAERRIVGGATLSRDGVVLVRLLGDNAHALRSQLQVIIDDLGPPGSPGWEG